MHIDAAEDVDVEGGTEVIVRSAGDVTLQAGNEVDIRGRRINIGAGGVETVEGEGTEAAAEGDPSAMSSSELGALVRDKWKRRIAAHNEEVTTTKNPGRLLRVPKDSETFKISLHHLKSLIPDLKLDKPAEKDLRRKIKQASLAQRSTTSR